MKPKLLLLCVVAWLCWSCNDQCKETRVVRRFHNATYSLLELRTQVKAESPRALVQPGKMYVKGKYLYVNEIKKGIHIIDNGNPASPKFVTFINIPGNGDIAVRDNILYADSYSDLVSIDITDPAAPKEVGRVKNVFKTGTFDGGSWSLNETIGAISDQDVEWVTETVTVNCEDNISPSSWWGGWLLTDRAFLSSASSASPQSSGSTSGQGGSMARFALDRNFLYAVGQSQMHLFKIDKPSQPIDFKTVDLGWGIETIFPYDNKLFIGSSSGMFIYDNIDPAEPKKLSMFQHGRACDPVVVHEGVAYVTLRTGTACGGGQNQLDLVDVSNPSTPQLIKSYQMESPHGLSVDFPTLFLCEGEQGLKVFDVSDRFSVDKNQLAHFKDMHAYDVISLGKTLLLIGEDGFYQYDSSNPKDLRLLSKIPVGKAI
ncbi:LVIVD repeat-containing protein [Dyadobacter sp. BHUBP1]|uniref:LVIVD repeat-containing protein n=1 Tax=Dyadobacter sp. BHUBP1 TaxID=3424178 RepID=UPI003D34AD86